MGAASRILRIGFLVLLVPHSEPVLAADTGPRQLTIYWRSFPSSNGTQASGDYNRSFAASVSPDFVRAVVADLVSTPSEPKQAEYVGVLYYITSFDARAVLASVVASGSEAQRLVATKVIAALDKMNAEAHEDHGLK
jgi:hypothetical protein